MALYRTRSATLFGIDARLIDVEVDLFGDSERGFVTVGMPDTAVKESRERIRSAIVNSGFGYPSKSVTINLAPANVRKEGAGFDLPMAVGILGAMGRLLATEDVLFVGELSLDGGVRPIRGLLPIAACARKHGIRSLIVPLENAPEAAVVDGLDVFGARHLNEAVQMAAQPERFQTVRPQTASFGGAAARTFDEDFADVRGQSTAKRALEVAAAGGHNVLLIGPPGSGKTMLARRLAGILPPLTFSEALEASQVHSVAGLLEGGGGGILRERPFRAPHHTTSDAGMIGGGAGSPRPGEVSLAHHGVLFLDELPEFHRNVLELLRQPIEEGSVSIARSNTSVTFPAKFMLVAAMNPCPCGFHGDPTRECRCTGGLIQRYLGKISGPLLDRIDLHIEVPAVPYKDLRSNEPGVSSEEMAARVEAARAMQNHRGFVNAQLPGGALRDACRLDEGSERVLELAVRRMSLSARAHDRILKVSRTIADLDGSSRVASKHIAEAVQYRSLDRNYWN